jgi:Questin oxidase-like
MNNTLMALLNDGARFAPEFGGGMSNHLPMALLALQRLGASEARLSAYAAGYSQRLDPAPPAATWPAGDPWRERLGDRAAWPAYRQFFAEWLVVEEASSVLGQVLPHLLQGSGGSAFHGLIRCAYAVQSAHLAELADALAYWAVCWHHIGPQGEPVAGQQPVLATLAAVPRVKSDAFSISRQMRAVAGHSDFDATVASALIDEHSLPLLAQHAAELYAGSGNFVVLHLVTGCHALRTLLPFVDEPLQAVRSFWFAYAAGHAAADVVAGATPAPLPWAAIIDRAIDDDDEHVIKLVDSCREHERAYGGEAWRVAATRAVAPQLTKTAAPAPKSTARKRPPATTPPG